MTGSKDFLRGQRFTSAQRAGWEFCDSSFHPGEGLARKAVLQMQHPTVERLFLFIGPRGGLKTGRSYRSSACQFWQDVPSLDAAATAHGKSA